MHTTSTITAQIEDFAQNIYLNQALVQNNRVEDLMDICALEQLLQLANLQGHTQPILEMGYGTGYTSTWWKALKHFAPRRVRFMAKESAWSAHFLSTLQVKRNTTTSLPCMF